MQAYPDEWYGSNCRKIASRVYHVILYLYPKNFRRCFASEMSVVFAEAFDECAQQGLLHLLVFLTRELFEAPISILRQHIAEKTFRLHFYPKNVLAFALGSLLIGMAGTSDVYQFFGDEKTWIFLFGFLFAGAISGLAVGSIVAPHQKKLFAAGGAAGILLVNMLYGQVIFHAFMIPLFYPLLMGMIIGLFLGIANSSARVFLHWTGMGCLALLAGFFANRLSAALIQNFLFHSPTQDIIAIPGLLAYIVIPYLLEGMLLGTLFSGLSAGKRLRTV
jgi:hypothetical protein